MGYLSQKKHTIRQSIFFKAMAYILALWNIVLLVNPDFEIVGLNLFHLYLLSFAVFISSCIAKRFNYALLFFTFFIICYTNLSSSSNIFISDYSFNSNNPIRLSTVSNQSSFVQPADYLSQGTLLLYNNLSADYVIAATPVPTTIIRLNLPKLPASTQTTIFNQLNQFITSQNNPVIVFGRFGTTSWSKSFRTFLKKTGLSTKNSIISSLPSPYNIFSTPDFYILGFDNISIIDIPLSNKDSLSDIKINISLSPLRT